MVRYVWSAVRKDRTAYATETRLEKPEAGLKLMRRLVREKGLADRMEADNLVLSVWARKIVTEAERDAEWDREFPPKTAETSEVVGTEGGDA
jgi:hypothetical protein